METRIRPLSSPWSRGFAVSGKLTSGPFSMWGAMTMKMIRSTSTTSTSGVTLMADWVLPGLTGRMGRPRDRFRYLEQEVHELGRSLVHLDLELVEPARELVEGHDGRDRDEDAESRRDQGLGDAARHSGHPSGPVRRDAPEGVDDPDHGAEQADERGRRADRRQKPETPLHLDQRLLLGVVERARDDLERIARIASGLARFVLDHARRDHLGHVRALVLARGVDHVLEVAGAAGFPEHGLERVRLARGQAEAAVLVPNERHPIDGELREADHHRVAEYADVSQQFRDGHYFLPCAAEAGRVPAGAPS